MTEPLHLTFGDEVAFRVGYDPNREEVSLDRNGPTISQYVDLSASEAHTLADWIKENIPMPKSPAEIAFDAIEIGQHFGFYYEHETKRERFPYTKVSKTTYEPRNPEPWHEGTLTIKPASGLLPFAQPHPTLREQFDALPVGTVFTWGRKGRNAVKVSEDRLFDDGAILPVSYDWDRPGDLEVIPVD